MTAGRGIVHSERTPERLRGKAHRFLGLQTWVALPREHEEDEPDFAHHPAAVLPMVAVDGVEMTIVAGRAFGEQSPVHVLSDTLYVSMLFEPGAYVRLPPEHAERALYPVEGELSLDGLPLPLATLIVLDPGSAPVLRAQSRARVMLLGGEPLDGPRFVWWNFVSSSKERLEQAKKDWAHGKFDMVPGETEFIPLPE
jgi:redox-sensitive bicupin YhaK (pirin superfamily)